MKCPECGNRAFVTQTRTATVPAALPGGREGVLLEIRRRHHCQSASCGCRFTTIEQVLRDHTYTPGRAA